MTAKTKEISKNELFQSLIDALTEFQIICVFDNNDIIVNIKPISLTDLHGFEYAIFHQKKWYKVVTSEKDTKIKLFEQNDSVEGIILSVLVKDSEAHGPGDLITLAGNFITETEKIKLNDKFKDKSIWVAETPFGKLLGIISSDEKFHLTAIQLDSELHFNENYYDTEDVEFKSLRKITKRYFDAFVRDENSKYEGLKANGDLIKF